MNKKLLAGTIVLGLVFLVTLLIFIVRKTANPAQKPFSPLSVSPNVLYLTSPVMSFSGEVQAIKGNAITVTHPYSVPQTVPIAITVMPGQAPVIPTPQTTVLTYTVMINQSTQITQPPFSINFLFVTPAPSPTPKLTINNIKVGQVITINADRDLRTLTDNTFTATAIQLPQIINTISGKIIDMGANTITVMTIIPMPPQPLSTPAPSHEQPYVVRVTGQTEISRMSFPSPVPGASPSAPIPEKFTFGDLKKDMQVTVYSDSDVTTTQSLTALRIEPLPGASSSP